MFADRLTALRRERGFSQEQLADMLGVTRQSVSKWEAGSTMPELEKLVALADEFGTGVDYLVRENMPRAQSAAIPEEPAAAGTPVESEQHEAATPVSSTEVMQQLGELKQQLQRQRGYEYKSKAHIGSLPLVHVKFVYNGMALAKGVVAIGNAAVGVVAVGAFSAGVLSTGGFALGLLSLGGLAFGGIALGGLAVGVVAVGGCAVGMYALGGAAIGQQVAVGGAALSDKIAIGAKASAEHAHTIGQTSRADSAIGVFINRYCTGVNRFFAMLFTGKL